jgi:pilus assembly protein CpaE
MSAKDGLFVNGAGRRVSENLLEVTIVGGTEARRIEVRTAVEAVTELRLKVVEPSKLPAAAVRNGPAIRVTMALLADDPDTWVNELRGYSQAQAETPIIALVTLRSGDAIRAALQAGAEEVVFLPVERDDLTRCLVKMGETHKAVGSIRKSVICSLTSVAGGVGVSSLIVALGFALRRITEKQVVLVDLSLQCSALSGLLDIEPEHTISELVDPNGAIDSIRLESVLCKHESGLCLLAAPKRIEEGERVSGATVGAALAVLGEMFDFVLVDCGHHLNEGSVAAWRRSDSLVYVISQSVTSIRPAQRFIDLFERLHLTDVQPTFLVNRFRSEDPITLEKIEKVLRQPAGATIPVDDDAFAQIQLSGAELSTAAPNSPARRSIDDLARKLAGAPVLTDGAPSAGVLSRLRTAVGRYKR